MWVLAALVASPFLLYRKVVEIRVSMTSRNICLDCFLFTCMIENVCEINMFIAVFHFIVFRATPESPQWSPVTRSSRLGPSAIWKATPSSKSRWPRRSTTSSSTSSCSSSRSCWWPSATPWSWPSSIAAQVRASGWGESRLRWGYMLLMLYVMSICTYMTLEDIRQIRLWN